MQQNPANAGSPEFRDFSALVTCYHLLTEVSLGHTYETPADGVPDPYATHICGSTAHAARLVASAIKRMAETLFPSPEIVENVTEQKPV